MQKFQCLLYVLKGPYICYYIIYMTVPLQETFTCLFFPEKKIIPKIKMILNTLLLSLQISLTHLFSMHAFYTP